ncbi:unnamed protein product [Lepidochelys kempii]
MSVSLPRQPKKTLSTSPDWSACCGEGLRDSGTLSHRGSEMQVNSCIDLIEALPALYPHTCTLGGGVRRTTPMTSEACTRNTRYPGARHFTPRTARSALPGYTSIPGP